MSRMRKVIALTVADVLSLPWQFLVNWLAPSLLMPRIGRYLIYRFCGISTGTPVILPGAVIKTRRLKIGAGTYINYRCFIDNVADVTIGERTAIAMDVMLCTSSHEIGPDNRRAGSATGKPITIGNGCWIGTRVTVLPGVTIGDGCVVAAGAVVTMDCAPNGLYAGIPARRVKDFV